MAFGGGVIWELSSLVQGHSRVIPFIGFCHCHYSVTGQHKGSCISMATGISALTLSFTFLISKQFCRQMWFQVIERVTQMVETKPPQISGLRCMAALPMHRNYIQQRHGLRANRQKKKLMFSQTVLLFNTSNWPRSLLTQVPCDTKQIVYSLQVFTSPLQNDNNDKIAGNETIKYNNAYEYSRWCLTFSKFSINYSS